MLSFIIVACGGGPVNIQSTPLPTDTPTPRATPLPTVPTAVPYGSTNQPFEVVLVPPQDSTATGKSLADLLNNNTNRTFKVIIAASNAEVLTALCGPVPTVAFVDGWTLAAAQAQGCATPVIKYTANGSTGIASDIVVSPQLKLNTLVDLKNFLDFKNRNNLKDFAYCRMGAQDVTGWILPILLMRGVNGFNPLVDFPDLNDYDDATVMMRAVVDGKCAAAIPKGTLAQYRVPGVTDITKAVKVLATTPVMPYGGVMVSSSVPQDVADRVVGVLTKADSQATLKDYVAADTLVKATSSDFAPLQRFFKDAGMNPPAVGVSLGGQ